MMGSAFIFPIITKRYNKKRQRQREELRQKKYSEYLEEKRKELDEIVREQTQILNENLISLESCYSLIENKKTFKIKYKITTIDNASLESIMLIMIKGEK